MHAGSLNSIAAAIGNTALSGWVFESSWTWPFLEIVHFIGLSLLLGSTLVADLRLIGVWRALPIGVIRPLLAVSLGGFALNFVSGSLFVIGDPGRYLANAGFRFKMLLVLIAGLNALWFHWRIRPAMHTWPPHGGTPASARYVALVSLGAWTGVLLLGRLIPYIGSG